MTALRRTLSFAPGAKFKPPKCPTLGVSTILQFTSIPAKYGFRSVDTFIAALSPYASARLKARIGDDSTNTNASAGPRQAAAAASPKTARGGKTRYTDQHKAAVRAALAKGDKTVKEVSKQTGVSEYATIDWKEAWGLVKHRKTKKKAAKKK
jgi:hypothetical protein